MAPACADIIAFSLQWQKAGGWGRLLNWVAQDEEKKN
jgi:hypothetical protein